MRDAFGGAFSIKLMLVFLMLYISFICVALNYARAFRVKNRIINIIEQNEGYGYDSSNDAKINQEINAYLGSTGYHVNYSDLGNDFSSCGSDFIGFSEGHGYCIVEKRSGSDKYYLVETYMLFRIPIIDTFTGINFPIRVQGETRIVDELGRQ